MPYESISELPESVKDNLPKGAQEIFKGAFNSAWNQYKDDEDREEIVNRIVWSAVKKKYEKKNGKWKKKEDE